MYAPSRPGLGTGIYTYNEAARLLKVHPNQVRRWADGYVYAYRGEERRKEPVLQRVSAGRGLLTFRDLIELHCVREFTKVGVRIETIRDAAKLLAERWRTAYPLANDKLRTDGQRILMEAGEHYEDIAGQQHVFSFVENFFEDIQFDPETFEPQAWYPLGRGRLIVLDPHRSFGSPIDLRTGVRTDVIYLTYKAEQDLDAVAEWYEVTPDAVRAAVEFEESCIQRAA